MIIVDTSAVIAIALAEPDSDRFLTVVSDADEALISAPTVLELEIVLRGKVGTQGRPATQMLQDLAITIAPFTLDHLAEAVSAFRRFGKGRHPAALNFGDCFSYALAKAEGVPLLFKGDDFSKTDIVPALA